MELMSIFSAFGLSASAGLNAYIPLLTVALLGRFTNLIELSAPWDALTSWWIIGLLVVLCIIELFADSTPAINHINDIIQTIIRPTAGAILFASSAKIVTEVHPVLALGLGLFIAGGVHAAKSAVFRPAVTATTGGTANVVVAVAEDAATTVVSILSIVLPVVIACILVLVTSWIIWRLWRKANIEARST